MVGAYAQRDEAVAGEDVVKARELVLEVALELLVPHGQRAEDLADRDGGADLARRRRALEQLAAAAELERRRDLLAGLARGDSAPSAASALSASPRKPKDSTDSRSANVASLEVWWRSASEA